MSFFRLWINNGARGKRTLEGGFTWPNTTQRSTGAEGGKCELEVWGITKSTHLRSRCHTTPKRAHLCLGVCFFLTTLAALRVSPLPKTWSAFVGLSVTCWGRYSPRLAYTRRKTLKWGMKRLIFHQIRHFCAMLKPPRNRYEEPLARDQGSSGAAGRGKEENSLPLFGWGIIALAQNKNSNDIWGEDREHMYGGTTS